MAKGYPDFFGQSVFPHYGALQQIMGDDVIIGVDTTVLIDLQMKGSIQSGQFEWTFPTAGYENGYVYRIYVDGAYVAQVSMDHLQYGYLINPTALIFKSLVYDEVHPMYMCELTTPITFIESFQVWGIGMDALGAYNAAVRIYYYEIT